MGGTSSVSTLNKTAATFISYIFWECKVYVGERGILKTCKHMVQN